ncbi:MAG TPA: SDR family NAD(P)-dependent oxidoreductase, partial [Terriglobia bacterium]|nr:SDR family NAD(P)-dependent oxidoreductase [Terriglobia bacterium]
MKLEGRVALITGAGSGIGRAIALRFAEEGASVAVNDIVPEAAARTVGEMGASRERGFAVAADVASSAEVKAMFARVAERFGGLDILVNNAGIGETRPEKSAEMNRKAEARIGEMMAGGAIRTHWDVTQELSDEEWHRMIGVHLNGT